MKYNLDDEQELAEAATYLAQLAGKHQQVEIKRIVPRRTLNQNSYLHLIISAFGDYFGYDLEEAKMIYKYLNKDIYMYTKNKMTFWRSSAKVTKDEMRVSIDRFRAASMRQGYELPLALDQKWLQRIENDLEKSKYYEKDTIDA